MPENFETSLKSTDELTTLFLSELAARYKTKGVLGQGGMGVVFRATDLQLDREVAIKVIAFEGSKDPKLQERFLKEAKTLVLLDHSNVVKLLSSGVTENENLYLVMEYIEGTALSHEIGAGKKLSAERFHKIFSQLLTGLQYLHAQGVVHRDLKPGNFIVSQTDHDLQAKIIDFGIARLEDEETKPGQALTRTGTLMGSPKYMSPEQCKGGKADKLSDIYSLACVMYEALTGAPPFDSESAVDLMYKHCMEEAPALAKRSKKKSSRRLGQMLDRCLQKDPSKRPQSAGELLNELNEIFNQKNSGSEFFSEVQNQPVKHVFSLGIIITLFFVAGIGITTWLSNTSAKRSISELANSELAEKASKKENQETQIRELTRVLDRKKHLIHSNKDSREQENLAWSIYNHSKSLAALQREIGQPARGEQTLRDAMKFAKYIQHGDSQQAEAFLLHDIILCRIANKDLEGADQTLQEALKKRCTSLAIKALRLVEIEMAIKLRDFQRAGSAFNELNELIKAGENIRLDAAHREEEMFTKQLSKRHAYIKRSEIVLHLQEAALPLQKIIFKNDQEKLQALSYLNTVLQAGREADSDAVSKIASQSQALLKSIGPSTAGYANVAAKSYKLWAEIEIDDEKAAEFETKAKELSR